MINLFWPIIIVVVANTLYNISAKLTPSEVHPFASLSITYFIATLLSILLFLLTSMTIFSYILAHSSHKFIVVFSPPTIFTM